MDFSESELIKHKRSLRYLEQYAARRVYKGYDPYDVLMGKIPFARLGKWPPILAIQLFKRNPLNFRRFIGVPKSLNPKALGLFLHGYSLHPGRDRNAEKAKQIFELLQANQSPVEKGMGWGYPFPWASPKKFLPAWSPTAVVTGFVIQGMDAYYRAFADERALDAMKKACAFIEHCLYHTAEDDIYAISYSTAEPDFCYNASLLAAEVYARTSAHTSDSLLADKAKKALNAVINRQKSDGSWNYSEDLETGKQRVQIDFHQGFVLDSIMAIAEALNYYPESVERALQEGFEFYRDNQFDAAGRAKWRLPGEYPADIHHQAQGIITASRYYRFCGSTRAAELAKRVSLFTLANFQDRRGYFYYRKHRYFTDRTSYMRWGNAWMFLALSEIVKAAELREQTSKATFTNEHIITN